MDVMGGADRHRTELGRPVTVVFLGGMGRSGSTLLSRVLDRIPGFVSVGELCNLWNQGVLNNQLCGCSMRFSECSFWKQVGEEAFGGWGQVDATDVNSLRLRVERLRYLPRLAMPQLSRDYMRQLQEYGDIISRVYMAIRIISDASVIVDSSKKPSTALLLHRLNDLDVNVVHLVRSPYGVCYAWTKHVARSDVPGQIRIRVPMRATAQRWLMTNTLFEVLRLTGLPTMLLRYEDFVAAPRSQLQRILAFLHQPRTERELDFLRDDGVVLGSDHSVWGSPMRIRTGHETLRLDDEWRLRMPVVDRFMIAALTGPALLRYGYSGLKPRRTSGEVPLHEISNE